MKRHALAGLYLVSLGGCSAADATPERVALAVPSRESFARVAAVLEPNCGTRDCHGHPARNFRVYGARGLRASGDEALGGSSTSEADIDATYRAVVGIEPEALSRVFVSKGEGVDRWVVVSKARGREHHVGSMRLVPDGPGDRCLVSWASGALDADACAAEVFGPIPRDGEMW